MSERRFRRLVAHLAGRDEHRSAAARLRLLDDVVVHDARLRRLGSRKRRKLDVPRFEGRYVLELVSSDDLDAPAGGPYRGVSESDLQQVVKELVAQVEAVERATLSFTLQVHDKRICERLDRDIRRDFDFDRASLDTVTEDALDSSLGTASMIGRADGHPAAIADLIALLRTGGVVSPWNMRARWH